jgi:AraC family transcriptional regulator
LLIQSLGVAIAACVVRRHCAIAESGAERQLNRRQFLSVCDFIENNLARPLPLDELAAVVGLSTSHFKTLFKASAGVSAHAYIMRRRVARASALIKAGAGPLSEIALEVGFADQSHMAKIMRRELGITPGVLARSL